MATVLASVVVCRVGLAAGQWPNGPTLVNTPHNLTRPARNTNPDMVGRIRDYGETCVYCHTPHAAATTTPVLWNRPTPTGPYRMYVDARGPLRMIIDAQPTDNSRKCLSCHDGTIGLDVIQNFPNTYAGPAPAASSISDCEGCHSVAAQGFDFQGVDLGTDLRKHHPISVTYDPSRAPGEFRSAAEVEAAGAKLYQGKVQCMSCHEPHTQRDRAFLRITRLGGAICLACHTGVPAPGTAHAW